VALMLMNLPIIVWMLYTYFKEIPGEILEASADGRRKPLGRDRPCADADGVPGIASTCC
jgi:sorbitol/mannitol transport system permease protein